MHTVTVPYVSPPSDVIELDSQGFPLTTRPKRLVNLEELADKLTQWVKENIKNQQYYLLGDFAFMNDLRPGQLIQFARKSPEFKEAYLYAKEWQEHIITKSALQGQVSARFAQWHLGCNHGWKLASVEDIGSTLRSAFNGWVDTHLKDRDLLEGPKETTI